jgi:RNA polymerase sigma-70 factor (ECF subfamily)
LDTDDIQTLRDAGVRWLRKSHRTLTREEHEDVLQDSLIELVRAAPSNPGGLLGTIIDRRAVDLIRAKKSRAKVEVPGGDAIDLSVMTGTRYTLDSAIFASDFNQALRNLSEDARIAFILCELRGLTAYEAARVLDVPVGTVYGRLSAAKAALRKEL